MLHLLAINHPHTVIVLLTEGHYVMNVSVGVVKSRVTYHSNYLIPPALHIRPCRYVGVPHNRCSEVHTPPRHRAGSTDKL